MNIIELERSEDRRKAGEARYAHLGYVVVTRSAARKGERPIYTVWLSAEREVGESRFCISQTSRLGFAAQLARACADPNTCRQCGCAETFTVGSERFCRDNLQHRA